MLASSCNKEWYNDVFAPLRSPNVLLQAVFCLKSAPTDWNKICTPCKDAIANSSGLHFPKVSCWTEASNIFGCCRLAVFFLAVSFSTSPTCWSVLKGRWVARSLESLGSQPTSTSSSGNTMAFLGLQWGNEQVWNAHLRAVVDAAATTCEKKLHSEA